MIEVFYCRPSVEDDRPQIEFEAPETGNNDWLTVGEVIEGTRPITEFPSVSVQVFHPDATQWDCYLDGGVRGLFSQRFADAVGKAAFQGLMLLPGKLNGANYYFLRCDKSIDCLDRSKAVFETFRSDPTAIKRITHYAFRGESLPEDACFVLPELPDLLLTEPVVKRLQAANLKGLSIEPLP